MNPEFHPSTRSRRGSLRAYLIATSTLLLLLGLGTEPARAELEIAVSSGLVDPGDSVDIPVTITTSVPVVAVHLDVSFDSTYLSVGTPVVGDVFVDHQVVSHVSSEGVLRMVVYSLTNGTLGTGTLVTLPFSVAPNSPEGTYFLQVTAATIADPSALAVMPDHLQDGHINVGIGMIFIDSFESGDTSAWSSSVPPFPRAGILAVSLKPARGAWVQERLAFEQSVYRAAFRFDPYTAIIREGDFYTIFAAYQDRTEAPVFAIELGVLGGQQVVRAKVRTARGFYLESGEWPLAKDESSIEIAWWASTPEDPKSGGGFRVWLNGELAATLDGLENAAHRLRVLRMGAFDSGDSEGQGTLLFGDYEVLQFRQQ